MNSYQSLIQQIHQKYELISCAIFLFVSFLFYNLLYIGMAISIIEHGTKIFRIKILYIQCGFASIILWLINISVTLFLIYTLIFL